ncbi:discoidin domain-containing protein [Streptomyces sp. NPDC020096]
MSDVVASGVGAAGTYGYGYPNTTAGTFAFNLGSGKSGWSLSPTLTAFPNPGFPTPPPTSPPPGTNLALHQPTAESSHTQVYGSGNAVDGDKNTYWESTNNAFPQWRPVDLGSTTSFGRLVLDLPPVQRLGHSHPDRHRFRQRRWIERHHTEGIRRIHPRSEYRKHRYRDLPGRHRPLPEADLHRQHRLAGGPTVGT